MIIFIGFLIASILFVLWYNIINWSYGTYVYAWIDGRFKKMRQCFDMDYHNFNCYYDGDNAIWAYQRGTWLKLFTFDGKDRLMKMHLWYRYGDDFIGILYNSP